MSRSRLGIALRVAHFARILLQRRSCFFGSIIRGLNHRGQVTVRESRVNFCQLIMASQNGTDRVPVSGYQSVKSENSGLAAEVVVDLRSDTLTLPSQKMRDAIANAVLGDDVFDEDPTTKEFEKRVANLLGKEAALLVTSGTKGNLIASLVHCNVRGSEMICGDQSHMFKYEQGNVAQFGGIHSCQIENLPDGTYSLETLKRKIRDTTDFHYPTTKLVCVENTHNRCGGRVIPLKWLDELAAICKRYNLPIHMDGARLFNASIVLGVPVSRLVRDVSSVSICFSKGLGAPAGSVIAGSEAFIYQARRLRKALGGGMRQNGIISAAGLYCLDNMIDRLQDDHDNAKLIAEIVNAKKNARIWIDETELETNFVMVHVKDYAVGDFCALLDAVDEKEKAETGTTISVKCFPMTSTTARLVVHFNISKQLARQAALKICYLIDRHFSN